MSAPALEQLTDVLSAPENLDANDEFDVALVALQEHFGEEVRVRRYDAYLRRDYTGNPSDKVRVGGALIVECSVFEEQEFKKHELVIDDANRVLPEDATAQLGSLAETNWLHGKGWIRDYGRNL